MKMTLIKYPPHGECEYEVIGLAEWNSEKNTARREAMRPIAGPYFDTEGWMLNAALADFKHCNITLVEEESHRRHGISIYRNAAEVFDTEE